MNMQFRDFNLGHRKAGEVVEVSLSGSAANVRLLDSTNFSRYRSGGRHDYIGGLVRRSPVALTIPRTGNWHVAVDLQGLRGNTRAFVRMLPAALPPFREPARAPLAPLVQHRSTAPTGGFVGSFDDEDTAEFDVFISHASEDKSEVVRPLANALVGEGLRVWYDEFELRIGDSIRRKIDMGLARSNFGVVVLSPAFFSKGWPQYELDGLVNRSVSGEQALLPIWHRVTRSDVVAKSPSLADKIARNTTDFTVEDIAKEVADVILGRVHSAGDGDGSH